LLLTPRDTRRGATDATDVHVAVDPRRCRVPDAEGTVPSPAEMPAEDLPAMTPIAAYYVMVVTDLERERRSPRYDSIVPKPSLLARIARALETFVSLGRPATTQPV
jgi:hypothetical protein